MCLSTAAGNRAAAGDDVPAWLKPLAWTNPTDKRIAAPELEVESPWMKPMQLRSDVRVEYRVDEYSANEPTFETVKRPFNWSNPTEASTAAPERKLTDEEQIAFEKEHYAWIRPFYWDNKSEVEEVPTWQSHQAVAARRSSWNILAPFVWTNPNPGQSRLKARTRVAYNDAILRRLPPLENDLSTGAGNRTAAFMQQDGEMPTPIDAPAAESDSVASGAETLAPGPAAEQLDSDLPLDSWVEDNVEELGVPGEDFAEGEGQGIIAEAETLGEEPDDRNTLQFLRADTVLLDPGEMQFDYGVTYSLFDAGIVAINSSSQLETARFRQRELLTPLEIRYGFTRRLQLFVNAPFGWSNIELTMSDFELFENDGGLGDVVFGGTFLVRQGNHCCSDIVWTNSCSAPTGIDPLLVPAGQPGVPSLGNGTWSLASNLLFIRTYDPLVVFYGFGTRQHFTRDLNGQSFRPGQEYNYQMGIGFAVNSKVTLSSRFSGAYITESRLGGQRFLGTIQEPMVISLALTIAQCNGLVEPFVDFGVTDEAIESRFGVVWTRF